MCPHAMAKCRNCRGPHFAQANVFPKWEAKQAAKGWGPPSSPRRVRSAAAPSARRSTFGGPGDRGRGRYGDGGGYKFVPEEAERMEELRATTQVVKIVLPFVFFRFLLLLA